MKFFQEVTPILLLSSTFLLESKNKSYPWFMLDNKTFPEETLSLPLGHKSRDSLIYFSSYKKLCFNLLNHFFKAIRFCQELTIHYEFSRKNCFWLIIFVSVFSFLFDFSAIAAAVISNLECFFVIKASKALSRWFNQQTSPCAYKAFSIRSMNILSNNSSETIFKKRKAENNKKCF